MLFQNEQWKNDIDLVLPVFEELSSESGSSFFITGSAGLIGTAVVHALLRFNDKFKTNFQVIATGRTEKSLNERFADCKDRKDLILSVFDAEKPAIDPSLKIDYIIHAASNASPKAIIENPVETLIGNICGLSYLLAYAKENAVKRVLFVSSSEVYGCKDQSTPSLETEYGSIDPLNPRNAYSYGKCAAETLCVSFLHEYDVDSVIVRPGHIFGPTCSEKDVRVSSAWAYDCAYRKDIVMKSAGSQIRSYCYCLDCASAILKVLVKGEKGQAYNISNKDSIMSIRRLAEIMTSHAGVELVTDIPSEAEAKAFNPMENSSLDSTKLENLGWKGVFDAKSGVSHTIDILREVSALEQ